MEEKLKLMQVLEPIQAFVSISALILAGIWTYRLYIKNRLDRPKIRISDMYFETHRFNDSSNYIRIKVIIENIGLIIFKGKFAKLRLRQVFPLEENFSIVLYKGYDQMTESETRIEWPMLFSRKWEFSKKKPLRIEPNENHELLADFIIPSEIKTIEIYFYFENYQKCLIKETKKIGWSTTKIFNIKETYAK